MARLETLARALPPGEFDVHFASAPTRWPQREIPGAVRHPIRSISPERVERAVRLGTRIYSARTLSRYVEDDLLLLDRVQPDLVVGDLRWSLSVSARLRGVPYAALINAYWSPHAVRDEFPLPNQLLARLLENARLDRSLQVVFPAMLRFFARPLNAVRRKHGLPPLTDLLEVLTDGDLTLHPDPPELIRTERLPPTHRFLGPVLWQPGVPLPPWWSALGERPAVYVTLGSSGPVHLLPALLRSIARLPVDVIVATAGRKVRLVDLPPNVLVADYLPGDLAVERAAVVVTNGGSSTGYQALVQGRPVIGVPWNLDQLLATQVIDGAGAGSSLAARRSEMARAGDRVAAALGGAHDAGVGRAQRALRALDSVEQFLAIVRHRLASATARIS